jgi:death on curing protein
MISKEEIIRLHHLSIAKYEGAAGIRDEGLLESAIARPCQTFGGEDLYQTAYEKAAAIMESIIINHPFVDGNKRTGFLTMFAILQRGSIKLTASDEDMYSFTIGISTGDTKFEDIVRWLKQNSTPY